MQVHITAWRFKMLNDEQKNDSDLGSKDASYVINKQKMAIVLSALASGNRVDLTEVLEPLHPADIADIIEQLNTTDRARFIRLYDTEFYGDILSEIDEHIREEVIAELLEETASYIKIQNGLVVLPSANGSVGFAPWATVIDNDQPEIALDMKHVIYCVAVAPPVIEQYAKIFGSNIVLPEKKLIV